MNMKILIHLSQSKRTHSTGWIFPWVDYCQQNNIEYVTIDLLRGDTINFVRDFDILLWHFGQYNYTEMLEARSILYSAQKMGLKVFPDFNESWHFDDKIAEMYALQSVNAPIPESKVFYDMNTFEQWMASNPALPVVGKLRTGSGSHNVKLLKSKSALRDYAKRMFGKGYDPAPSLLYKTTSNVRSSHDWKTFKAKAKRIPEFLRVLSSAKKFPNECGYVYLQEFVPNDGYDMKVVVVGDKLSGFYRPVRTHDFRASGGGEFLYDKKMFTDDIIKSAFSVAKALGVQCIGFDYVVNKNTGKGLIVEMSYGFSHTAVLGMGGYFDKNGVWYDKPLNVPEEIIKNMLK